MEFSDFKTDKLTDEDIIYVENVMIDIRSYIKKLHCDKKRIVLLFPPINNFRRFLIHQLVNSTFHEEHLSTISVGTLSARRTVVFPSSLKLMDDKLYEVTCSPKVNIEKKLINEPLSCITSSRKGVIENLSRNKERKIRKPDIQLYVPRGRRLLPENCKKKENIKINYESYKNSFIDGSIDTINKETKNTITEVPKEKIAIKDDGKLEIVKIGTQINESMKSESVSEISVQKLKDNCHLYVKNNFSCTNVKNISDSEAEMREVQTSNLNSNDEVILINSNYDSNADNNFTRQLSKCDEVISKSHCVKRELTEDNIEFFKKSSSEIQMNKNLTTNNKNDNEDKKVEKCGINSDEIKTTANVTHDEQGEIINIVNSPIRNSVGKSISPSSKKKLSLNVHECNWEELFDESGEYVDENLLDELMNTVGKVTIHRAEQNYTPFQTQEERTSDGDYIIEIYGFPAEFKTDDLISLFASYRVGDGFQIVWVDDTHALGVFSSPTIADEILNTVLPFIKTRPLKNAIPKSRIKARDYLVPVASRPKTCVSLARRLVSGHLGMKINVTDKQKEAEKKLLSDAREQKRLVAKQKLEAWEGIIPCEKST